MIEKIKDLYQKATSLPMRVLSTKQNVVIIQLFPKNRTMSVSYKGQVKTGAFQDNTLKNLLHNGQDYDKDMLEVLGGIGNLLEQLIKYNR